MKSKLKFNRENTWACPSDPAEPAPVLYTFRNLNNSFTRGTAPSTSSFYSPSDLLLCSLQVLPFLWQLTTSLLLFKFSSEFKHSRSYLRLSSFSSSSSLSADVESMLSPFSLALLITRSYFRSWSLVCLSVTFRIRLSFAHRKWAPLVRRWRWSSLLEPPSLHGHNSLSNSVYSPDVRACGHPLHCVYNVCAHFDHPLAPVQAAERLRRNGETNLWLTLKEARLTRASHSQLDHRERAPRAWLRMQLVAGFQWRKLERRRNDWRRQEENELATQDDHGPHRTLKVDKAPRHL